MSQQLEALVERATRSELFTAPRLADDLDRFLREHGERVREIARRAESDGIETAYFVGSGHFPFHDDPDRFIEIVERFIDH